MNRGKIVSVSPVSMHDIHCNVVPFIVSYLISGTILTKANVLVRINGNKLITKIETKSYLSHL